MNTLVALYDTMEQARKALQELKNAGFNSADISLVAQDATGEYGRAIKKDGNGDGTATGATAGAILGGLGGLLVGLGALVIPGIGPIVAAGPLAAAISGLVGAGVGAAGGAVVGGLLGALVDMGVPEEEAGYYAEGIRRGGALVTAHIDDNRANEARMILQRNNPVNIDERVAAWKKEGWTGYQANAKPYTTEQITKERERYTTPKIDTTARDINKGGEVAIPVVEERLNVGKKEVEQGGVRVHKYVQERPVEADVTLREEHVKVDRRPVDRPAAGIGDTFKETTIDVTQKAEKAVVNKEARVVEEVVVRKDVNQRTEKVRDTVKRTDVQVEELGNQTPDMNYQNAWRQHYQTNYVNTGKKFDYYEPAYRYGYTLRNDKRYSGWDWNRLEPEARRTWEKDHPNTWEQFKAAIRNGWEDIKQAVR